MAVPKPEASPISYSQVIPLRIQVQLALQDYFRQLGEQAPANLYKLVMEEVEQPLLEAAMRYTRGNQTRAAQILGINRSTLRKKLKQYHLE
jgi:Fis family transcriptional regulator